MKFFVLFAILVAVVYASCASVSQDVYDEPIYDLSEYYFFLNHVYFNNSRERIILIIGESVKYFFRFRFKICSSSEE